MPSLSFSLFLSPLSVSRLPHDAAGGAHLLAPKATAKRHGRKKTDKKGVFGARGSAELEKAQRSDEVLCLSFLLKIFTFFFEKAMPISSSSSSSSSLAARRGASYLSLRPSAAAPVASSTGRRRCAEAFACSAAGRRSVRGFGCSSSSSSPSMTSLVSSSSGAAAMPRARSRAATPRVVCHVSSVLFLARCAVSTTVFLHPRGEGEDDRAKKRERGRTSGAGRGQ